MASLRVTIMRVFIFVPLAHPAGHSFGSKSVLDQIERVPNRRHNALNLLSFDRTDHAAVDARQAIVAKDEILIRAEQHVLDPKSCFWRLRGPEISIV